jgi:two-component system C4-dicarboxylate transport sensor histidine kinase DctB
LKQVLINLVGNAIDALRDTPSDPKRIEIDARKDAQGVVFSVSDNGPGVSEEIAKNAFSPFVTSKPGGTGLGLGYAGRSSPPPC